MRRIGGGVIHHNHLVWFSDLRHRRAYAAQAFADPKLFVMCWNNERKHSGLKTWVILLATTPLMKCHARFRIKDPGEPAPVRGTDRPAPAGELPGRRRLGGGGTAPSAVCPQVPSQSAPPAS